MFGRRGELTDVVGALVAQTRGESLYRDPPPMVPTTPALLDGYLDAGGHGARYDQAAEANGRVVPALRPDVPGAGPAASPRYGCGHGDEDGAIALLSAGPVDAASGSTIVNLYRGGAAKDTWILR
jgi:hypothetical protein